VSVRTADHVRAVAERLGYRAEPIFRPLQNHTSNSIIGVTVADATNPFYFGILRGAEVAAAKANHTVILIDAAESGRQEQAAYARVLPFLDGLVVTSSRMCDTVLRGFAKSHPVVVLNRFVSGLPCVLPDTDNGMLQAVRHLLALGHRQIGYLPGPEASWSSGRRWLALREAARQLGFPVHRLPSVRPTVEGGQNAARHVAERSATTAVICYNDLAAIGLIRGLKTLGLSVPEDVSLVGFDNIFASELVTPPLTTVASPMGLLGKTAVSHVIAMLGGARPRTNEPVRVPVRLIERSSTGPARAR
jgi:LacI family transcriptional regulator